jgi:hypothetical protein
VEKTRAIEFRGKSVATGEWLYGDRLRWGKNGDRITILLHVKAEDIHVAEIEVDPATVGQFTGLLDRAGKEIYEGDIVECRGEDERDDEPGKRYAVGYHGDRDYPAFDLEDAPGDLDCNGLSYYKAVGSITVIGNIYENPDLLK